MSVESGFLNISYQASSVTRASDPAKIRASRSQHNTRSIFTGRVRSRVACNGKCVKIVWLALFPLHVMGKLCNVQIITKVPLQEAGISVAKYTC